MSEKAFIEELELLIRSRYPVIWINTWEEERALRLVNKIGERLSKKSYFWDGLEDMKQPGGFVPNTRTPEAALEHIRTSSENGLYILFDFHPYLRKESSTVIRRMRKAAFELKRSYKTIVVISPVSEIPEELEKQITILDLPMPGREELRKLLNHILDKVKKNPSLTIDADEQLLDQIVTAARGLTVSEAESLFLKAAVSDKRFNRDDLSLILQEKKQILRKSGVLEYFDTSETMNNVGGLKKLKGWLGNRVSAFTEEARKFGLPQPKGLLLLGVQGCGKSLIAKAIASLWQLPLLKLDVGSLFSSYIGSTEANMRKAISVAESISPVILWLDEIEKGLSGLQSSGSVDAGVTARVFSSFLSWMQEKTSPVFVVATANDVRSLPPELMRKGRFDEIFFVDLPNARERGEILKIHLDKKGRDQVAFRIGELAAATEGYSGAELEDIVISGMYTAFAEGRDLTHEDMVKAVNSTIPLSRTMAEKIGALRSWARNRAVPAS